MQSLHSVMEMHVDALARLLKLPPRNSRHSLVEWEVERVIRVTLIQPITDPPSRPSTRHPLFKGELRYF